jgi:hypothetical protein
MSLNFDDLPDENNAPSGALSFDDLPSEAPAPGIIDRAKSFFGQRVQQQQRADRNFSGERAKVTADPLSTPDPAYKIDFAADSRTIRAGEAAAAAPRRSRAEIKPLTGSAEVGMVVGEAIDGVLGKRTGAQAFVKGAAKGAVGLSTVLPGAASMVTDAIGADEASDFLRRATSKADQFGENTVGNQTDYVNKMVAGVGESVVANLPSLGIGVATGSVRATLGALYGMTASKEYDEARRAGFEGGESFARANIMAAAEVLGERFGLTEQLNVIRAGLGKVATKDLPKMLGIQLVKEIPGEQLTTAIQFAADKYGPAAMNPQATFADYLQQAADTAVQTVGQGLVFGAPAGVRSAAQRAGQTYRDAEAAINYTAGQPAAPSALTDSLIASEIDNADVSAMPQQPVRAISRPVVFTSPESRSAGLPDLIVPTAPQAGQNDAGAPTVQPLAQTQDADPVADMPGLEAENEAKVGSWLKLPYPDARGTPVAQVRELPVGALYLPELTEDGQLQPEKRAQLDAYTQRAAAGETPPNISVVEMEDGRLRVVDGHRRVMAARAAGVDTIRATVSPLMDHPDGRVPMVAEAIGAPQARAPEAKAPEPAVTDWQAFPPAAKSLGIPRAEMPQVPAEQREALVSHLEDKGISTTQEVVQADSLKATQAEVSPSKVEAARAQGDTGRRVLVSSDGYVVDGHHQWAAADGGPVRVTRLNAPIASLLPEVRSFAGTTIDTATASPGVPASLQAQMPQAEAAQPTVDTPPASPGVSKAQAAIDKLAAAQAAGIERATGGATTVKTTEPVVTTAGTGTPELGMDTQAGLAQSLADGRRIARGETVKIEPVAADDSVATKLTKVLSATLGRPVWFFKATSGKTSMNAANQTITVNGKKVQATAIRIDASDAPIALAVHEGYHGLDKDLKQRAHDAVFGGDAPLVSAEERERFKSKYPGYADEKVDEEMMAFMSQQAAKERSFWEKLRDKVGDDDFGQIAGAILKSLEKMVSAFRGANEANYARDMQAVYDVLSDVFAEQVKRKGFDGKKGDADAAADTDYADAERGKAETVGGYEARAFKDGSIRITGDAAEIRAKLPDGVVGRDTKQGLVFTATDAPRVRRALEGNNLAYSRAGEVLDKLPMRAGKYVGAPAKFDTPGKIPHLRKLLMKLTLEGERGRFWYENSSREVLRMAGGNVQEARKFVALLAIYSPQAKVDANTTFALRAWAQYKAGQPISVKTGVMDAKAKAALDDVDAFWSGEKTGNFFHNLLREIDPSTEGKQGATIDMWMMRAGQYDNDAPTSTQYAFMENETNRIAAEMGWEPQQVQAAIWVAMKARMENEGVKKDTEASSEKKGWIRFDKKRDEDGKQKKVRVILDAQRHRDNWLKHSFDHVPTEADTSKAKFDFADGLLRHIGQISFEARPGRTSGSLPGIHDAPYAQQVEFQQAVQAAMLDDQGRDLLAHYLGLMVDNDILAPGVWQGEVSPSSQKMVAMAPAKGDAGKTRVDPAQAQALNVYASVLGLVARQEGVGWHRPFYASTKAQANGVELDIGRPLNPREVADLERAVGKWMDANGKADWQSKFAFISAPTGIRLVNFGIIENRQLHADIVKVAGDVLPDGTMRQFASDGDMPTNDWKEYPNGQIYRQRISASGRSDVLDWARTVLAPRVQRVFDDFSERYGWGDAGTIDFSDQEGAGVGERASGRRVPSGQDAAPEQTASGAGQAAAQTAAGRQAQVGEFDPLPGAPRVRGFTGPDPRLVAVAKSYADSVGIKLERQSSYAEVDPARAARIAQAYEDMPHAPRDPAVREAYENLIKQTTAQYQALVAAGYKFWFMDMGRADNQEYASTPWNAMRDIRANQTMGVFPTEGGFGSGDFDPAGNPLLADTGFTWPVGDLGGPRKRVLANDLFRAVHDAFGHGLEGAGFRAQGEENAWQAHTRLFTGSALGAITSETRGQNSWLNYGPHGEANRTAQVEDTVFADQKTGLMPSWTWEDGRIDFSDQTETEAFKRWFGDSKVVDADGKPLVVYHGTNAGDFSVFNVDGNWGDEVGAFFTTDPGEASSYGSESGANVRPVYLTISNPYTVTDRQWAANEGLSPRDARDAGYDGYVIEQRSGARHFVAFRPEQIKSAIGNRGTFDPADARIDFSDKSTDSWGISRNEVGQLRLGAGSKLYRAIADIANTILTKFSMRPMTKEMSRYMRKMKQEIAAAQELISDVADGMSTMSEGERMMISDIVEKELNARIRPPAEVLKMAQSISAIMSAQSTELVRLGMLSQEAVDAWSGRYLPRFYESKLRTKTGNAWEAAAAALTRRPRALKGISGGNLKRRGMVKTIMAADLAEWEAEGWKLEPGYDPETDVYLNVHRDFTREERDNMGEIRDAMFRFVMGYNNSQKDIALGRMYESMANDPELAAKGPRTDTKDVWVQVPKTKVEDTKANVYGKLAGMYVPEHVLAHLTAGRMFQDDAAEAVFQAYRKGLALWKEGKALALDTPIPTPTGWTTMGDIKEGDKIFDENGAVCDVVFTTPVQHGRKCYVVEFSDGEKITADAEHLWFTVAQGKPGVRTTEQILATLKYGGARNNNVHSIPVAGALQTEAADLPVHPYFIGAWLGDGSSRSSAITSSVEDAPEIQANLARFGFGIGGQRKDPRGLAITYTVGFSGYRQRKDLLAPTLSRLGLKLNKHIPQAYLRASPDQRMLLLQGLMDTDGTIDEAGKVTFCTASEVLRDNFLELVASLGFKAVATLKEVVMPGSGVICKAWNIRFHAPSERPVFLLPRKAARQRPALTQRKSRALTRQVVNITMIDSVPVRCIQVSSESRLYLAGRSMIPTHNTVLNPVSHMNNIVSNLTMAHFAGVSYWDQHKYIGAARDLIKRDPMVKEGVDAGLFGGTFNDEELLQNMPEQLRLLAGKAEDKIEKGINATWNALAWWMRKPLGTAYEAEDKFFRYLLYRDARKRGLDPDDAVDWAMTYIFAYDDLPKGARIVRDFALPFFSYTYKFVPAAVRTALETPWRVAAPAGLIMGLNTLMYAIAGDEDDEETSLELLKRWATDPEYRAKVAEQEKLERENLPIWMRGQSAFFTEKTIRLGQDDATGLPLFLDIARFIPGGDLFDANNNAGGVSILQPLTPSNPLLTSFGAMIMNRDMFTGRDVVDKDDTTGEAAQKRAEWLWRQFSPAIALNSYHWDRSMQMLAYSTGEVIPGIGKDYTGFGRDGLPVQPKHAIPQTLGIKVRPIDLDSSEQIDAGQRRQLIANLEADIKRTRRLAAKMGMSDEQADAHIELQRTKIDRLREGKDVDGKDIK